MKKIYFLFLLLIASTTTFSQGSEDFENHALSGTSYVNGSFVGNNGITWNYVHVTGEQTYPINGKGILLRRSDEPSSISATFSGGIGNFSVNTRKAFTGNLQRRMELLVNGNVVAQFEPTYASGADATVVPFIVNGINVPGDVTITLRLYGVTGNQQLVIDDLVWTGFAGTGDPGLVINTPTEGQILAPGANTIVTFSASNFDIATPGNGDGHLHYTVNGGSVTMVYTNDPIDLGILTPGADYTVAMELVDDSHNALVPPVTASVNFSIAACGLSLTTTTAVCDAFTAGTDTYTATVNFTGGGTDTYVIISDSGTVSGDDPSVVASGTITISGIAEGTNVNINVSNGGLCDLDILINSPACDAAIELPAYEGFNYTVGASLNDQANWDLLNTGDNITIGGPGGLTYPGLAGSAGTGNHIAFDGAGGESVFDFSPATTGTVYASFIFTITDQSNVTNADGSYFASISSSNTSYDARLWVKPNPVAGTTYEIGVGNNATSPTGGSNSGPYNVGDVVFVVMSYDMATGNINGWVNPSDATFGAGSAPAATVTAVDASPATSIAKFVLRQDTAVRTPFILLDELRIGNTWADVTPTTLSNDDFNVTNFKIYPNPTSTGFVNITSTNADAMSVAVFDVLGKQVINETLSNNRLDVSSLNTGVYIVKISQNNATTTKKLVIK